MVTQFPAPLLLTATNGKPWLITGAGGDMPGAGCSAASMYRSCTVLLADGLAA